jgi:hypothetical protein
MRQPHHLALYWVPGALGVDVPAAHIIARLWSRGPKEEVLFGGQCVTEREIDELINEMIQDLEDARKLAHERFDH